MNGEDADLDRIGQCVVKQLYVEDPTNSAEMQIRIKLRLYACVCASSGEGLNLEAIKENASPELKEYFLTKGVDLNRTEEELYDDEKGFEIMVEYFQEQATMIACGADPCPNNFMAFMWNDDAWEGGTNVTLSVPFTCEEYESIEGEEDDMDKVLSTLANRIATEIYDSNKGGTPQRDKVKLFEEEVGLWNDMINQLECYHQPTQNK